MDLNQQLEIIRKNKHSEYLKQKEIDDAQLAKINNQNLLEKKINILEHLANRYAYLSPNNKRQFAAYRIQKFIRRWFNKQCINSKEIANIPAIYRIRIDITNYHTNEYSEENETVDMVKIHRLMYSMVHPLTIKHEKKMVLFRYCFDIRKLFLEKNQMIKLYNGYYFMQPEDHERIIKCWDKVNNETNYSIKFLNKFEYDKSLTLDREKELRTVMTRDRIKEIILNEDTVITNTKEEEYDMDLISSIVEKYING